MAVGLSGNLGDFGIADVFQLIGQQRKTGVLELRNEGAHARLIFDRGMVVSAEPVSARVGGLGPLAERLVRCGQMTRERAEEASAACRSSAQALGPMLVERGWLDAATVARAEELITHDTIFEVLRWRSGSFDFRAQAVHHDRDPVDLLGAEQILMDGLRMVDEWQALAKWVPSDEIVFERTGSFEDFAQGRSAGAGIDLATAESVFGLVDGRLSARRIVDLAQMGRFDGMRCLAELREAGAIGPVASTGLPRPSWRPRTGAAMLRRAAAGIVPLALLAGAVWATAQPDAAPAPAPAAIERSTLADLRSAYAGRAVRHAIEAYRFDRGQWPSELAELERARLLDSAALAAPYGRPYYSVRREPGLIVLAPER